MIQKFADWLVYDIFGLKDTTPIGEAVNFFLYDKDSGSTILYQSDNGYHQCLFSDRAFTQLSDFA